MVEITLSWNEVEDAIKEWLANQSLAKKIVCEDGLYVVLQRVRNAGEDNEEIRRVNDHEYEIRVGGVEI